MSTLKKMIPSVIRRQLGKGRSVIDITKDFYFDYQKYLKNSASLRLDNKEKLESYIIKEYHAIEKGLALREPRKGFGISRVNKMIDLIYQYINEYGKDNTTNISISALREYIQYSEGFENPDYARLKAKIDTLLAHYGPIELLNGGTKPISKSDILKAVEQSNFDNFINSRFSIRTFSPEPVSRTLLQDAVRLALTTPSVCNRQAWRVFAVDDSNPELREKLLKIQNGNAGFRDQIKVVLVVTGKISSFFDYERNQVFIDGGMFAMSLVLALHSKGLATCCLNMSLTAEREKIFSKTLGVNDEYVPIMYNAVGHMRDNFKVAQSSRKSVDEILINL